MLPVMNGRLQTTTARSFVIQTQLDSDRSAYDTAIVAILWNVPAPTSRPRSPMLKDIVGRIRTSDSDRV
jgi:hypothetical protein